MKILKKYPRTIICFTFFTLPFAVYFWSNIWWWLWGSNDLDPNRIMVSLIGMIMSGLLDLMLAIEVEG